MKKLLPFLLITALLSTGCSSLAPLLQIAATPTSAPPEETFTPVPTVTRVPTQDLFATATFTPTTIGHVAAPTLDPSKSTEVPLDLPTFAPPPNSPDGYYTPTGGVFLSVLLSGNVLYWNSGPCWPRSVTFTAFVTDPLAIDKVLIFMRLRSKKDTLNFTDWGGGAIMKRNDNGSFTYEVGPKNISKYYLYKDAWVEYQLVAITEEKFVLGRTAVNDRTITLARCQPIP